MKWRDNAVSIWEHLIYRAWNKLHPSFVGFFQAQLEKSNIPYRAIEPDVHYSSARTAQEIDDLEESLKDHEGRITQMNNSYETLLHSNLQLAELRHVLKETSVFFEQVTITLDPDEIKRTDVSSRQSPETSCSNQTLPTRLLQRPCWLRMMMRKKVEAAKKRRVISTIWAM